LAYLTVNNIDLSQYTKGLVVRKTYNYNAQTNAAGNTIVDVINSKRIIEAVMIPMPVSTAAELLTAIDTFSVSVSFTNPISGEADTATCILPEAEIEYLTLQTKKKMTNEYTLTFEEL
jgi:hypothetical protein